MPFLAGAVNIVIILYRSQKKSQTGCGHEKGLIANEFFVHTNLNTNLLIILILRMATNNFILCFYIHIPHEHELSEQNHFQYFSRPTLLF